MQHGLGMIRYLGAILTLALGLTSAQAADANISLLHNTDLPGFDYAIVKDTTLDACSAALARCLSSAPVPVI